MDYARPLLFAAAILTALCLLVNSLLLAVESNRRVLATLRTVGLTRGGVLALVTAESLFATGVGWLLGCLGGIGALVLFVAADPVSFPVGSTFAWGVMGSTGAIALVVAFLAVLFALRPALAVRPLDVQDARPHRRRHGMAIAFACGFAAFVAVEVWGASLMRAFVPSPEWPDAIVSILPGGVSSFDVEKLRAIPGVKRISELMPLQLDFYPEDANNVTGVYKAQDDETLDLEYTYMLTINGTDTAVVEFVDGAIQVEIGEVNKELGMAQLALAGQLISTEGDIYAITALVIAYYDFLPEEGVEDVVLDPKAIKSIVNGQVVIEKAGKTYNMNGAVIR